MTGIYIIMKINFTQDRIRNLSAQGKPRVDYYDTGCPKLTCRVSNTGIKSFVLLKWNGRTMQRVTLGRFPDISVAQARKMASVALSQIADGYLNPEAETLKASTFKIADHIQSLL